ncbi:MAG: type II secretion system protein [Planctomycetota bacterium]
MKQRKGFTLIELLVTIAVIAVLIGILLPAIAPAWDAARKVACGANLRSIGQALEMYKNDHKDAFPVAKYMPDPFLSGSEDVSFPQAMANYIDPDSEAYRCPGDKIIWETDYTDEDGVRQIAGTSYTYVAELSGRPYEQTFFYEFLRRSPSDTPVSYDFDGGTFETQDGREIVTDFFHRTRNIVFVDGHVGNYGETGTTENGGS